MDIDRDASWAGPTTDFHVHTRVSGCCKENYGIEDALDAARARGIERLGITDHDVPFKNGFLVQHRRVADRHDDVLLGLEVSIRDLKGRIQVSRRNRDLLDFMTISEHVHVMPGWTFLRRARERLVDWWNSARGNGKGADLVERFYARHATMTRNAIIRNHPDVLAHPWRFPWHRGFLDIATLDAYGGVLEAAGEHGVKIELSRSVLRLVTMDLQGANAFPPDNIMGHKWQGKQFHHELASPASFFKEFIRRCRDAGLQLVLGSDAHRLADVGSFPPLGPVFSALGIRGGDIATHPREG